MVDVDAEPDQVDQWAGHTVLSKHPSAKALGKRPHTDCTAEDEAHDAAATSRLLAATQERDMLLQCQQLRENNISKLAYFYLISN